MFKDELYNGLVKAIEGIDLEKYPDIYTISVLVIDNCGGYAIEIESYFNTESQFNKSISRASSAEEARWNLAFFDHDNSKIYAVTPVEDMNNLDGSDLFESDHLVKWLNENNIDYDNEEELESLDELIPEIAKEIIIPVISRIKSDGIILNKFGRDLPILVHDLEYYITTLEQMEELNGKELTIGIDEMFFN